MAARERYTTTETAMWRSLGLYRCLALLYAAGRFSAAFDQYAHPAWAAAIVAAMAVWTIWTVAAYRRPHARLLPLVAADLAVAAAAVLSTRVVDSPARWAGGGITLPTIWSSAPVVACAIAFGWRGGLAGSAVLGAADLVERGAITADDVHNITILLLAGTGVGYVSALARTAERTLIRAQRLEAAARERHRLARDIHDGVLQVLALVQRQGAEMGGRGAELGRMAGEQEYALRSLVNGWHDADRYEDGSGGVVEGGPARLDLCVVLGLLVTRVSAGGGPRVTLSSPGAAVELPGAVAREVAAAVSAALDNVQAHGGPGGDGLGARAWILIDTDRDAVLVSVRDDGPGIAPGRLREARSSGRRGVAHSIEGRIRDVGGSVQVLSVPGQGTEVELRVPRAAAGSARLLSDSAAT
jgi:signal transduction histidine kinase